MQPLLSSFSDLGLNLPHDRPFTLAHARDCGVSPSPVSRLTRAGILTRLVAGVYVASQVPDTLALRCTALALALPSDTFVCDRTAAWIYRGVGSLGPGEHLSVPPLSCFRRSGRRRLRNELTTSGERAVRDEDLRELNGLVITTELRTALDLGRLQPTRDLRLWGMDNLLATGAFGLDELLASIPRFKGERGVIGLRALAPLADPLSQSFGESALRLRWYDAGLPRPRLQIPVALDDRAVYLDMGLEDWRFAAEYDGEEWHTEPEDVAHDRERRERLENEHRWRIEVFRRQQVFGIRQDADLELRRAAVEARGNLGRRLFAV